MKRMLFFLTALSLVACAPRAAKIPSRAAIDLQCPVEQLTVLEVDHQGDTGAHLVRGCGRKATYELNNFDEWVSGPILNEPQHVQVPSD